VLKHKLDLRPEPDALVIGISSHVNDYRLCWALNRSMGIALARRATDVVGGDSGHVRFAAYDHLDDETGTVMTLLVNRSGGVPLIREQKDTDFFFVLDENGPLPVDEALVRIRNTEFVLAAYRVDLKRLRSGLELFV
jgi:hypothetical protein